MKSIERTPIYSIIIPHRNVPDLLKRLLHSIPQRDDVEIIVVDDNSSPEFQPNLLKLQSECVNARFVFMDKCMGGGAARNVGLEQATGNWILFADADDFFNYCINEILDDYKECDADIVYFNANSLDCHLYTALNSRVGHLNCYIKDYNETHNEQSLRYRFGEPWCKMVRREIIMENSIRFEETSIHNDTAYSYLVGFYAQKMEVDKRALYCVTGREDSVSKGLSCEKKLERIGVFARAAQFFKTHAIGVKESRHFKQLLELKRENKQAFSQAFEMLQQYGYSSLEIKKELWRQRFRQILGSPKKYFRFVLQKFFPNTFYKIKIGFYK